MGLLLVLAQVRWKGGERMVVVGGNAYSGRAEV